MPPRCVSASRSRSTTTRSRASRRCRGRRVVEWARAAEAAGFDSLWLSDHLFLDVAKYGGPPERAGCLDPIVALAALARRVTRLRLGTLVLCEALRPAAVLAKALASLDVVCDGRLDVGIGAGWYEPEYAAIGMDMPRPGERLDRLREAIDGPARAARRRPVHVRRAVPPRRRRGERAGRGAAAATADHRRRARATACSRSSPTLADGWNTCWAWTPAAYRERLDVLERACDAVGRDPATVTRSLGLYTLCGEDERDLERRFERLQAVSPAGVLDACPSTSGARVDWWAPSTRSASRPTAGRRSAWRP